MGFEWDPKKAAANARKHGVRFADAVAVLEDDKAVTLRDDTQGEERWVTIVLDALWTCACRGLFMADRRHPHYLCRRHKKNVGNIWRTHEAGI
jgi:hypothetical protein